MADEYTDGSGAEGAASETATAPAPTYLSAADFHGYRSEQEQRWNELQQNLGGYFNRLEARLAAQQQAPPPAYPTQPQAGWADPREREAADALHYLISKDPRYAWMAQLAPHAQQIQRWAQVAPQMMQGVQGLSQAQEQVVRSQQAQTIQSAGERLRGLAEQAGYPAKDPQFFTDLCNTVGRMGTPQQQARFRAGDTSVVDEIFRVLHEGQMARHQRDVAARALGANKARLRGLPPAPSRSGMPQGGVPARRLDPNATPDQVRAFQEASMNRAAELYERLAG